MHEWTIRSWKKRQDEKKSEKDVNMFSVEIYFLGFVQENVFGKCNIEAIENKQMQKKRRVKKCKR